MEHKKMTKIETNRYLHSVIEPDGCYHEWKSIKGTATQLHKKCIKCEQVSKRHIASKWFPENLDYFTKDGFWVLWEWAIKQEWFGTFLYERIIPTLKIKNGLPDITQHELKIYENILNLINFEKFPELLAGWLRGRE
jgi:hypothetical protein